MWVVYYCIFTAWLTQGMLFPSQVYDESKTCSDNNDCVSGCCLKISMSYRKPIEAICQPMGQFGQYCAPGDRLRKMYGSKFYTYSCPCQPGLECTPLWSSYTSSIMVIQDPKCAPKDVNVHSRLISRFLYNSYRPAPPE